MKATDGMRQSAARLAAAALTLMNVGYRVAARPAPLSSFPPPPRLPTFEAPETLR